MLNQEEEHIKNCTVYLLTSMVIVIVCQLGPVSMAADSFFMFYVGLFQVFFYFRSFELYAFGLPPSC